MSSPFPSAGSAGSIAEIQVAVQRLSVGERWKLLHWLSDNLHDEWNLQIERGARDAMLRKLVAETRADYRSGRCRPMEDIINES